MTVKPGPETDRRRSLWLALKLLALAGFVFLFQVFFSSVFSPEENARPPLTVELSDLPSGQAKRVLWNNVTILILHRDPAMIAALRQANPTLKDPESRHATQPDEAENPFRSLRPEYFVVIAHSTDLGCEVDFHPANTPNVSVTPWYGGFRDRCGSSWYDLAGRVYDDQPAPRNLPVPPYEFVSPAQIVIGN